MIDVFLAQVAASAWALPVLALLVVGDAFLVVIPGEAAVTAFGALGVSTGAPNLVAVIAVAAVAAFAGDLLCYLVGRRVGLDRWRWMRGPRVQRALAWAAARLDRNAGTVVFTARFIPFARLALNLTAGATRIAPRRYLPIVGVAAVAWACYQAVLGALIALVVPGGPVVAVIVSVIGAILLGALIDVLVSRRARRARESLLRRRATAQERSDSAGAE